MPEESERRGLLISKVWVQASIVVFLLGFFVLGLLAYRTYSADPPIPHLFVQPSGPTVFTTTPQREPGEDPVGGDDRRQVQQGQQQIGAGGVERALHRVEGRVEREQGADEF